jgi:hypothetical protein
VVLCGLIVVLVLAGDDDGNARPPSAASEVAAGVEPPPADPAEQPAGAQNRQSTRERKHEKARDEAGRRGARNEGDDRTRTPSGDPADGAGRERNKPKPGSSAECPPGIDPQTCAALGQSAQGGPSQAVHGCPSPSAEICRALEAAYGDGDGDASETSRPSECPPGLSPTECEALAVGVRAAPSP